MCVAVMPPFQITAAGSDPDGKSRRVYWSLRRAINSLMCDADGNGTMIDGSGIELSMHAVRVLERQIDRDDNVEFPLDSYDVPNGRNQFASPEWAVNAFDLFAAPGTLRPRNQPVVFIKRDDDPNAGTVGTLLGRSKDNSAIVEIEVIEDGHRQVIECHNVFVYVQATGKWIGDKS